MEYRINRNFDKELRNFVTFNSDISYPDDAFESFKHYVVGLETLKRLVYNRDVSDSLLVREFINYYDISFDKVDINYFVNKMFDSGNFVVREMKTKLPICFDSGYGMVKIFIAFKKGSNIDTRKTYSSSRVRGLLNKNKMILLGYSDIYRYISKEDFEKYRVDYNKFISLQGLENVKNISKLLDNGDEYSKRIISVIASYVRCIDIDKDLICLYRLFKEVFSSDNLDKYNNDSKVLLKEKRNKLEV